MMNPVCLVFPSFCSQVGGGLDGMNQLLNLFNGNNAAGTLVTVLAEVQATPIFNLGLPAFLQIYRSVFGLVLVLTLIIFAFNLLRLTISASRSDDLSFGFAACFKIFLVGAWLPAAATLVVYMSQIFTKLVIVLLAGQQWQSSLEQSFSLGGFFTRVVGGLIGSLLLWELIPLQLLVPLLILLGLISYSLTAFKSGYEMGKPSRWMWALLLTALILKPLLLLFLGLGGSLILMVNAPDSSRSVLVLTLIVFSLFMWMIVFWMVNRRIETAVKNQVTVRGQVRSQRAGASNAYVDARRMGDARTQNINGKKAGLRTARHVAVDSGLSRLATKAAASPQPHIRVAGVGVKLGHAFFRGRRPR
jgi:hypothetical protein